MLVQFATRPDAKAERWQFRCVSFLQPDLGIATVALTGAAGPLRDLAQICVSVPSTATALIQEIHISVGHIICHIVERGVHPPKL